MGRSYTNAQYMKLRESQNEGKDCKHATASGGACLSPAKYTLQETVTDKPYAPQTSNMRYCARHFQSVGRMLQAHGVVDGTDVTTVHPETGQVCVYHLGTIRDLTDAQ